MLVTVALVSGLILPEFLRLLTFRKYGWADYTTLTNEDGQTNSALQLAQTARNTYLDW
jgi:hypothetical protein